MACQEHPAARHFIDRVVLAKRRVIWVRVVNEIVGESCQIKNHGTVVTSQRPVKRGGRFSRKAVTPS